MLETLKRYNNAMREGGVRTDIISSQSDATLAAVRATPGVRGAATTSLAIGGTSVMSVTYGGSIADLAAALRGRGFTVNQGSNALAIRR